MEQRTLGAGAIALQTRLKELGVSRNKLEQQLGLATGTLYRWYSGERTPDLASALMLERAIGLPVEIWDRVKVA